MNSTRVKIKPFFIELKMSSKNVQHFWFEVEASTKNGLYFCRAYLVTELNHIVFDFGHLNTINNLNVQINVGNC